MNREYKLKICFIGGSQAGVIGILTAISKGGEILAAVSYDDNLANIIKILKIPLYKSVGDKGFIKSLSKSDLLLSVHGREIVKKNLLKLPKYGAINIHPYLYKYKGANPVERALEDNNFKASVGAHVMEEEVDKGKVLVEEFVDVAGSRSAGEVYNNLYPYYCIVALKALEKIYDEKYKK